jgi:hypothetical protein
VHVVHPHDQRTDRGEPLEHVAQRPVRAVPIARRRGGGTGQRGQQRRERSGIGQAHARDPALPEVGQMAIQRLRPERVRQVALELRRARAEHGGPFRRRAGGEVVEQPGLADPRLAFDRDDGARPGRQRPQRAGDRLALLGTADQRGERRGVHRSDPLAFRRVAPGLG